MRAGKLSNENLQDGELALQCPACPDPNVNLPHDWKDHKHRCVGKAGAADLLYSNHFTRRLLYGLFLSGDGNFQLVRRNNRSGDTVQDSLLSDGAFWVQEQKFEDYLEAAKTRVEPKVSDQAPFDDCYLR